MHPFVLLIVHLCVYGVGLMVALVVLMFATGPSVQAGERAVAGWLAIGLIGAVASVVSLHRRLPAASGLAAKLGMDLLCLVGTAALLLVLGFVVLVVFNR